MEKMTVPVAVVPAAAGMADSQVGDQKYGACGRERCLEPAHTIDDRGEQLARTPDHSFVEYSIRHLDVAVSTLQDADDQK